MNGFNIGSFISEIGKSGVAHPTRYSIQFESSPSGLIKFSRSEQEKMNLRLTKTSFPQVSIGSKELNLAGLGREMPYGRVYEGDIDMEFLDDKNLSIRSIFERWQGQVIDEETLKVGYYNNYTCNLIINLESMKGVNAGRTRVGEIDVPFLGKVQVPQQLSVEEASETSTTYSITVYDVWPKSIDTIELASDSEGLITTKVGLSFRMWKSNSQFLLAGKRFLKTAGISSILGI